MKLLSMIILLLINIGCGGSGGSPRTTASLFVEALNANLSYTIESVKTGTRQAGYIIVKNTETGIKDAYYIDGYTAETSIEEFLAENDHKNHYDVKFSYTEKTKHTGTTTVTREGAYLEWHDQWGWQYPTYYETETYTYYEYENIYIDLKTGLTFTKSNMSSEDLTKAEELVDNIRFNKAMETLTVQFGFAPKRAKEVAGYALQLGKTNPAIMTEYKYDQYTKAILGSTISEVSEAYDRALSGEQGALNTVYKKAAKVNGMSVDQVKKISNLFIKN